MRVAAGSVVGLVSLFATIAASGAACGSFGATNDVAEGGVGPSVDAGADAAPDAGSAYAAAVLADNPVAYYRLEDDGATHGAGVLYEEVSKSYVGAIRSGAPSFQAPGAVGKAIRFDGHSWIELPKQTLAGRTAFTIELWVHIDKMQFSHVLTDQQRVPAQMKTGWAVLCDDAFGFERYSNADARYTKQAALPRATGLTHVVVTYDGASMRILGDGVVADTAPDERTIADVTTPMVLAAAGTNGELAFTGTIDEVALYTHVLDGAAIARHLAAAKAP
ncbi:MAG: Autotransporter adhesin [Labilithrix sp.]|nr:Autotransporter adhesin [Labilithrix sp.]